MYPFYKDTCPSCIHFYFFFSFYLLRFVNMNKI